MVSSGTTAFTRLKRNINKQINRNLPGLSKMTEQIMISCPHNTAAFTPQKRGVQRRQLGMASYGSCHAWFQGEEQ